jgi:hypothetical protein
MANAARIRVDDGGVSFGANERARVDQCVASKTSNYTFFLPALEQEVYIDGA